MAEKNIVFFITKVNGGGAEHILIQLANYALAKGNNVELCITNQRKENARLQEVSPNIPVTFLEETQEFINCKQSGGRIASIMCKVWEHFDKTVPAWLAKKSFMWLYAKHVQAASKFLEAHAGWQAVSFLQPAIPIVLMANENVGNPVIVSERGDPGRFLKSRYANFIINNCFPQVKTFVFQTPDAMAAYPQFVQDRGTVIINPIFDNLPQPWTGEREKVIVNFCRLSKQKNLKLLIDAFDLFADNHNDYCLKIIGDGELKSELTDYISAKQHGDRIFLIPHHENVTESIIKYAMFVSSSDSEGMSNSMLEAMAIGLPTICTDCPIGGARYVIQDGENGLLVPMNQPEAMAEAMSKIADDATFMDKLSRNSTALRIKHNPEAIFGKWMELLKT